VDELLPPIRPCGYKVSGVGRENHRMMLDHYTRTKCVLVSYDSRPLGLFQAACGFSVPTIRRRPDVTVPAEGAQLTR
jgi:hypothetical protein